MRDRVDVREKYSHVLVLSKLRLISVTIHIFQSISILIYFHPCRYRRGGPSIPFPVGTWGGPGSLQLDVDDSIIELFLSLHC